jgi:GNAT superfamily N-acetyltransferase
MPEITRAGVKDHGVVTGLLLEFSDIQGWSPEVDRDRWDRVLAELLNSDGWLFLLALQDDEAVGLAAVNWYLTLYGSREQARLSALFVLEGFRRGGIGTMLMEAVLSAARRRGCRELEASVDPADETAASFYARFDHVKRQSLFTWDCSE